jgi:acetyltransferase-like isoleucine patch superfamily enzyme
MWMVKKIIMKILHYKNPADYWRRLGSQIGEDAEIYYSASLGSEPYLIKLGKHVRINEHVSFITHDGGVWVLRGLYDELDDVDLFGTITVGDNVHIGHNTVIMPNVTIGSNCIIGCGAIVTKNIPDNSIAVGVPARVIETVDEYLEKHRNDFDHTKRLSPEEKKQYLMKKYSYKQE